MARQNPEGEHLMRESSDLDLHEMDATKTELPRRSSDSDLSLAARPTPLKRSRQSSPIWRRAAIYRPTAKYMRILIAVIVAVVVLLTVGLFWGKRGGHIRAQGSPAAEPGSAAKDDRVHDGHNTSSSQQGKGTLSKWKKPKGIRIIGFVFYGRPRFVNILDCYLKRNLISNGGFLDEVHWMSNTQEQRDIEWLDELVKTDPLYKKFDTGESGGHFNTIWDHARDDDTIYIKIDDDVVYVHDDAIPRMVYTLMDHPEALNVAANIINSPLTNWLHYHTGAVYPYVPDPEPPVESKKLSWRPSQLPKFKGNLADRWPFPDIPEGGYKIGDVGGPPYRNHRWLPLENTSRNLAKTPIASGAEYNPWGKGWIFWTLAAQQQYSLFEHIERDDFTSYYAGNGNGVWNMQYTRYNLNFLAIWGKNVRLRPIGPDDEHALTVEIPEDLKMPCIVDTHAIIGHYSFGPTPELSNTDLLDRYLAYANEMVCTKKNQRPVLPEVFYPHHD